MSSTSVACLRATPCSCLHKQQDTLLKAWPWHWHRGEVATPSREGSARSEIQSQMSACLSPASVPLLGHVCTSSKILALICLAVALKLELSALFLLTCDCQGGRGQPMVSQRGMLSAAGVHPKQENLLMSAARSPHFTTH